MWTRLAGEKELFHEHHLSSDLVGWFGYAALAAVALDVSEAIHSFLQWSEHVVSRLGVSAPAAEGRFRSTDPAVQ
ncbi:protein of unknown function [Hyphomicrobium sp. MC1]|nr:protein of unknown function [Hyphomicrobium sp. MC1]